MFRNDLQSAAVCQALCAWMGKGVLWDENGMTEQGIALKENIGVLSHGEQVSFGIALSLWNAIENKGPPFAEVWTALDGPRLQQVASLLAALAEGDVERWLEEAVTDPCPRCGNGYLRACSTGELDLHCDNCESVIERRRD